MHKIARVTTFVILPIILLTLIGCTQGIDTAQAMSSAQSEESATPTPDASDDEAAEDLAVETVSEEQDTDDVESLMLEEYNGNTVGILSDGHYFVGEPDAPITITEYSDYLCPFCGRHFNQTMPSLLEDYISTGTVQYIFHDFPIASLHPTAIQGHILARCVGEQGTDKYWEFHDELFSRQAEWSGLPDPSEFLATVAENMDLDLEVLDECMASDHSEEAVLQDIAYANERNLNGTPMFDFSSTFTDTTFLLEGAQPYPVFESWIEALLNEEVPPGLQTGEPEKPELPFWANEEGLAPDPEKPGFNMAGDPYLGDVDAPIVVVEFADFQCDSCARSALETFPAISEEYIDSGQVRWISKHLPLREHPQALAAATAAECAGYQGQYWEMHELLFETVDEWANDDVDSALVEIAGDLDLDIDEFEQCVGSRQALEDVIVDMYDANKVTELTPTFILLYDGAGYMYQGARSVENFSSLIDRGLETLTESE